VTFPKIYQTKFSRVNDAPIMIDVSIATATQKCILTIFCLFSVYFTFVSKKKIFFYFCVLVLTKYVSGGHLYDCRLGIQDGGLKFKMAVF